MFKRRLSFQESTFSRSGLYCAAFVGLAMATFEPRPAFADLPTLAELRQVHQQAETAAGTWRISETVDRGEPVDAQREAQWEALFAESLARLLAGARADFERDHGNDSAGWAEREAQIRAQIARGAGTASLQRSINSEVPLRRTRTVHPASTSIRWDDVDLRNLDQLAADRNLDATQRLNIDQTRITIAIEGRHLNASVAGRVAQALSLGHLTLDSERLRLGLVPPSLFDPALSPTLTWPNGPDVAVITTTGPETVRAVVDRTQQWRLVRYERETSTGSRTVWTLEDYSNQNGAWVPGKVTRRTTRNGVEESVEVMRTLSLQLNIPADPNTFELPSDFRVVAEPPRSGS